VRLGLIERHREWMIRSYVATTAFVWFRVIVEFLEARSAGTSADRLAVASWLSWTIPLLVTEVMLQKPKTRQEL
jgi:hypothetical protein